MIGFYVFLVLLAIAVAVAIGVNFLPPIGLGG